nr:hypothetical protein GCM10010200_046670 [Actinomadura rugatobispora]
MAGAALTFAFDILDVADCCIYTSAPFLTDIPYDDHEREPDKEIEPFDDRHRDVVRALAGLPRTPGRSDRAPAAATATVHPESWFGRRQGRRQCEKKSLHDPPRTRPGRMVHSPACLRIGR